MPLIQVKTGSGAAQQVQVGRLPGVHAQPEAEQHLGGRRRRRARAGGDPAVCAANARVGSQLAQEGVARLVEVAGHLEGEPAAGRDVRHQLGQQVEVAGHPLSVALETSTSTGLGGRQARRSPCSTRTATMPDAPGRATISGEESTPSTSAPGQRRASRAVRCPGLGAEVDDAGGGGGADAGDQLDEGRPRSSAYAR